MTDDFEPDLGIFNLPLELLDDGEFPEWRYIRHQRRNLRGFQKQIFWPQLMRWTFPSVGDFELPSRALLSDERIEELMAGLSKVHGEERKLRQPWETEEAMEDTAPQFVLRNLFRYEMSAWVNDLLWVWKEVRITIEEAGRDLKDTRVADIGNKENLFLEEVTYDRVAGIRKDYLALAEGLEWETLSRAEARGMVDK